MNLRAIADTFHMTVVIFLVVWLFLGLIIGVTMGPLLKQAAEIQLVSVKSPTGAAYVGNRSLDPRDSSVVPPGSAYRQGSRPIAY